MESATLTRQADESAELRQRLAAAETELAELRAERGERGERAQAQAPAKPEGKAAYFEEALIALQVQADEAAQLREKLAANEALIASLQAQLATPDVLQSKLEAAEISITELRAKLADDMARRSKLEAAEISITELRAKLADDMARREQLRANAALIADLRARLDEAQRRADLQPVAALSPVTVEEPTFAVAAMEGKVVEPVPADAEPEGVAPDPLIAINGIGPVFERRLQAEGIRTFRDLASQTPERLREIIAPAKWQRIEPEAWIAEAAEFAKFVERQDTSGA